MNSALILGFSIKEGRTMNKQMPSMPSIKPISPDSSELDLSPSFAEDSGEQSSGSAEVEIAPVAILDPSRNANLAEVRPAARGIQVVATEKGFYNQLRLAEGNEFTIRSEEDFGSWFKCIDPVFEKKRIAAMNNKKVKG